MGAAGSRDEPLATLRDSRAALRAALDLESPADAAGAAATRSGRFPRSRAMQLCIAPEWAWLRYTLLSLAGLLITRRLPRLSRGGWLAVLGLARRMLLRR